MQMLTYSPRQADADGFMFKLWQSRISRNRKAIRAANAMALWHKDPRSEGRIPEQTATVIKFARGRK
jgi:hypothetical protein